MLMSDDEKDDSKDNKPAGGAEIFGNYRFNMPAEASKMLSEVVNPTANTRRNLERGILNFVNGELMDVLHETAAPMQKLLTCYKCAMMEIETKFKVLDEQFSAQHNRNPIESIKSRLKSQESIMKKLQRRDYPLSLQSIEKNMTDVAGVRVICSFVDDIYFMADCLLRQDDIKLIARKDYIENPKPNGYRSLHLIVEVPIYLENEKKIMKVEVQLRTIAMDFWASLEHSLRYKKDSKIDPAVLKKLETELFDCAQTSAALDQRMMSLRGLIEKG